MCRTLRRAVLALAVLLPAGCRSSESTAPKENLDDREKQQIKDLQEQRQDEWGKKGKK